MVCLSTVYNYADTKMYLVCGEEENELKVAASCWIRMPTGCDRALSETTTPTKWFIDPTNQGSSCQDSRKNAFNVHCKRTDTVNFWGTSPPKGNKF